MKIGYLINQYPAVSLTFVRREILALEAMGVTVERYALRGWDAELVDAIDQEEVKKTRYTLKGGVGPVLLSALAVAVRRPVDFFAGFRRAMGMAKNASRAWPYHLIYLAQACQIMRWVEKSGIEHIHAHFGTNSTEIASLIEAMSGLGYSFTVHGSEVFDDPEHAALPQKVGPARFAVASCAYIASQTKYHVDPEYWPKVHVVHCGLPDEMFEADPPPFPKAPIFLTVGRLSAEKGQLVLLDAFSNIISTHPDARLVIVGDGPMRPALEKRIKELGLEASVRLAGWLSSDAIQEELKACQVFVLPSFSEGLPVVIMEAMAQQRPVISNYIAGIPELVKPGETGWLVPAGQEDELTQAMLESLSTRPKDLQAMGKAGYARVKDRHSIKSEVAKLHAYLTAAIRE